MDKMTELVKHTISRAQMEQKSWYDRTARVQRFGVGDQVAVLLPTFANKLRAQWQGPYTVIRKVGDANYAVDIEKCYRTFHVNMLKRWHTHSSEQSHFTTEVEEGDDIPLWNESRSDEPTICNYLSPG
jgi:hypothetical protein